MYEATFEIVGRDKPNDEVHPKTMRTLSRFQEVSRSFPSFGNKVKPAQIGLSFKPGNPSTFKGFPGQLNDLRRLTIILQSREVVGQLLEHLRIPLAPACVDDEIRTARRSL